MSPEAAPFVRDQEAVIADLIFPDMKKHLLLRTLTFLASVPESVFSNHRGNYPIPVLDKKTFNYE